MRAPWGPASPARPQVAGASLLSRTEAVLHLPRETLVVALVRRADLLPDHGFIGAEPFVNGVSRSYATYKPHAGIGLGVRSGTYHRRMGVFPHVAAAFLTIVSLGLPVTALAQVPEVEAVAVLAAQQPLRVAGPECERERSPSGTPVRPGLRVRVTRGTR